MNEESNDIKPIEDKSIEEKSLTEDIAEFNRKLDVAIGNLEQWKTDLLNVQEEFVKVLQQKVRNMKV